MWRKLLEAVFTLSLYAFVVWQTYRYSPVFGHCVTGASLLILALIFWGDTRRKERLRVSEHRLSELQCPNCDTAFGSEIAHRAFHPAPSPKTRGLVFTDDFGMAWVECSACKSGYIYHRMAACLQWKDENGEIIQLHANTAQADA